MWETDSKGVHASRFDSSNKVGTHMKARRLAVEDFMKSCDGKDITDPYNVKQIEEVS